MRYCEHIIYLVLVSHHNDTMNFDRYKTITKGIVFLGGLVSYIMAFIKIKLQ